MFAEPVGEIDACLRAFEEDIDEDEFGVPGPYLLVGGFDRCRETAYLMPGPFQDLPEIAGFDKLVFDNENFSGGHNCFLN